MKWDYAVGDEILVDAFDYKRDKDTLLREVVTQVDEAGICTLSYDGSINYYDDNDMKYIKAKTGRNFPEMLNIMNQLKPD